MNFNDLFLVTIEDTSGNEQQRRMVVAGNPAAVSCIQLRKSKFMYMCAYMNVFEAWDMIIFMRLI